MSLSPFEAIGKDMDNFHATWNPEYKIKKCCDDMYYLEANGTLYSSALPIEIIYGKIYSIYKEHPNRNKFNFEI